MVYGRVQPGGAMTKLKLRSIRYMQILCSEIIRYYFIASNITYGKCSKILNTSCLLKKDLDK